MPTTLTSTFVNNYRAGLVTIPILPGKLCAITVQKTTFGAAETVTAGQVIQMVPIPTGCEIADLFVVANWVGNDTGAYTIGDGSLTNRFCIGASLTASSRITKATSGIGYKYSVSDDVATPLRFDTIDISIGAGATQTFTGSILMTVYYRYVGGAGQGEY